MLFNYYFRILIFPMETMVFLLDFQNHQTIPAFTLYFKVFIMPLLKTPPQGNYHPFRI